MNAEFKNPYVPPKGEAFALVQTHLAPDAYDFVRCIRPDTGTVRTVVNILWMKLVQALKEYDITDITAKRDFESFVANLRIVDGREGRGAIGVPTGGHSQAHAPDERRGTAKVRR